MKYYTSKAPKEQGLVIVQIDQTVLMRVAEIDDGKCIEKSMIEKGPEGFKPDKFFAEISEEEYEDLIEEFNELRVNDWLK